MVHEFDRPPVVAFRLNQVTWTLQLARMTFDSRSGFDFMPNAMVSWLSDRFRPKCRRETLAWMTSKFIQYFRVDVSRFVLGFGRDLLAVVCSERTSSPAVREARTSDGPRPQTSSESPWTAAGKCTCAAYLCVFAHLTYIFCSWEYRNH